VTTDPNNSASDDATAELRVEVQKILAEAEAAADAINAKAKADLAEIEKAIGERLAEYAMLERKVADLKATAKALEKGV
jgi:regulator of protease activity HflC (stomatin/prohibitin superfamily)